MFATTTRRVGAAIISVAAASALTLGLPGTAAAAPAPAAPVVPSIQPNALQIGEIPFDAELAAALRMIKQAGIDKIAIEAAKAVLGTVGQLSVSQATSTPAASTDPLAILKALGITPLSPSVAPLCAAPTDKNPFGLVTAGAGAVKGPWPLKVATPSLPLNLPTAKIDPNIVKDGSTGYAFVPAAVDGGTGGKMQVAWFNTTTLKGGFADLDSVAKNSPLLSLVPGIAGLRLAPVDTGKGTVLSAVYGTAQVGNRTCYFLPAVGIV